ncbi:MAG: hypothetical protein KF788_13020 [Piscinibacter sp.]|nr:hypothetical protein [Piscinibacter sp.]
MSASLLVNFPADQFQVLADAAPVPSGGGQALERDLALAVALVAAAAALVLACFGG